MTTDSLKSLDSKVKNVPPTTTVTYEGNGDPKWREALASVYALILAAGERERGRTVPDDRPA